MTKEEIKEEVEGIFRQINDGDYEVAHRDEDTLMQYFIEYIAERDDELGEMAKIVLAPSKAEFPHYFG